MSVVIRLKVPIEMHYTVIPMGTSKVNSSHILHRSLIHFSVSFVPSWYALIHIKKFNVFEIKFRPWLLLRRCFLSNIGDRVRNISNNTENNPNTNPNPNPNIYTATYV